ncbi:MAG: molybdopterin-binding protein [Terracidiphilus sp.]
MRLDLTECLCKTTRRHPLHRQRTRSHRHHSRPKPDSQLQQRHARRHGLCAGGDPWILPIARDTAKSLDASFARASVADLLLITGGVSAGKFDLVEPALIRAGARFHFTGVRIQPGKLSSLASCVGENSQTAKVTPASWPAVVRASPPAHWPLLTFGLPGNPVSSAVTFLLFAAPVVAALAGRSARGPNFALARLTEDVKTKNGLTRFLPAACTFAGPTPEVALVPWQGSGDLAAMAAPTAFSSCLKMPIAFAPARPCAFCFHSVRPDEELLAQ